jgi:hypothetical protein
MTRVLVAAIAALAVASVAATETTASAAPKKRYHYELTQVTPKAEVPADVAQIALPRVKAQVVKAFGSHPQLVTDLPGAPDATADATGYRKYLAGKGLAGSYYVTVELTAATYAVEQVDAKPGTQRIAVHVALHMLGENIPGRTIAFTGEGEATIKQEVGKTIRQADIDYTWDQAAETAVKDAIETSLKQLAKPQPKQ